MKLYVVGVEQNLHFESYNETPISFYETFWYSPSGKCFVDYYGEGYKEAIEDCVKWLDSEWEEGE